jgi:hypothetical protein
MERLDCTNTGLHDYGKTSALHEHGRSSHVLLIADSDVF